MTDWDSHSPSGDESEIETQSDTDDYNIHRRALLQTGLVAIGFSGASGVSTATATRMGASVAVPGTLTGGLGADDRYLYAATRVDGSEHLSKVDIASGEEVSRFPPAFDTGVSGYRGGTTPESQLFAADFNTSQVLEVDPTTGETSGGFDVFFDPAGITYDPD